MSVVIETGRLRLRSHRDDDLGNLIALASNWEAARWLITLAHQCLITLAHPYGGRAQFGDVR
jgi:hypothetical protein